MAQSSPDRKPSLKAMLEHLNAVLPLAKEVGREDQLLRTVELLETICSQHTNSGGAPSLG